MGWETASALIGLPNVEILAVVSAPPRTRTVRQRLRAVYKRHGIAGGTLEAAHLVAGRIARMFEAGEPSAATVRPPGVRDLAFDDLHSEACIAAVRALAPDLAVVDGTYILKESLFGLPRLGSINLHCGKLPEYRGAPPAFWELMNGESVCGVSVHQVTAGVDEGAVYNQELLPIDSAPADDPVDYARHFWLTELRPVGLRLVAKTVQQLAAGAANPMSQPKPNAQANRMPDRATKNELRRRVAQRRTHARQGLPHAMAGER